MAQFNRSYMTSYQSAFISIARSCTIFELLDVEKYRDFEIYISGHSSSLEIAQFDRSYTTPINLPL